MLPILTEELLGSFGANIAAEALSLELDQLLMALLVHYLIINFSNRLVLQEYTNHLWRVS